MSTSFQKMEDTGAHLLYYEVYGNNNNPKCKRTIRCLNIKLNFGKERVLYKITQPIRKYICFSTLSLYHGRVPFHSSLERVSYNPVQMTQKFKK